MKKRDAPRYTFLLLLVALSLQGCFGIGENSQSGSTITTNSSGNKVTVAQNVFKGKIYFTIDHNLWVIDGNTSHKIISGNDIYDPAVSPDGKWIAYIVRYKDYSNLAYMPVTGGQGHNLLSGDGHFYNDSGFIKNTYKWYAQPAWSQDGSHLLFLSDFEKEQYYSCTKQNAPLLDLQVYSIPFNNSSQAQVVAYASFGDGGDRDPSYRPGHPNQVIYTHYAYDAATHTQQVIQIFMEDANAIANNPGKYCPGLPGYDPGVAITDAKDQNLEPAFAPDGNAIAYIRRQASGQVGLYIMSVPEGVTADPNNPAIEQQALIPYKKSSLILSQQFIGQPVWSPDGKQIVFVAYSNSTFDLWLANINYNAKSSTWSMQGSPMQLTTGGVDGDSRPFWTR